MKLSDRFEPLSAGRRLLLRNMGIAGAASLMPATPFQLINAARAQGTSRPATITTALSWIPNHQFSGMWMGLDKGGSKRPA